MRLNVFKHRSSLSRYLPDWLRQILRRARATANGAPDSTPSEVDAMVAQMYRLALNRVPNANEQQYWTGRVVDRHMSVPEVVEAIASSDEAAAVHEAKQDKSEIGAVVVRIYQLALDRTPNVDEVKSWTQHVIDGHLSVATLVETIAASPEADLVRERAQLLTDIPNGRFIQFAYELLLGRGAMAAEIVHWDHRLLHQNLGRDQMITSLFSQRAAEELVDKGEVAPYDPTLAHIMGTDRFIDFKRWKELAAHLNPDAKPKPPKLYPSLTFRHDGGILVSAIASLYRGGDYIHHFLENITAQTIFESCELIIIDADSPENEYEVIASYMKRFPNIVYHRAATRIGIYEAWNLGVEMSRGKYVTNTNLDDLRRQDSFERQVEILEKFPFVDVVYQDFYFSFDGAASFSKTATVGVQSEVPIITPYNLMRSNSPHNAPMWRRTIHGDVGMFDASYRSAGDYDFWLRCVIADKVFYKVNDPHVVYFVNPEGLSTQPNTRGIAEANRVTREYGRQINSDRLLSFEDDFLGDVSTILASHIELTDTEHALPEWRYAAVQRAMRLCSIASRRTTVEEV